MTIRDIRQYKNVLFQKIGTYGGSIKEYSFKYPY